VPASAVSGAPTNYNLCEGHKVPMNPHMSINAYVWTRTLSHSAIATRGLAHDCDSRCRGRDLSAPPLKIRPRIRTVVRQKSQIMTLLPGTKHFQSHIAGTDVVGGLTCLSGGGADSSMTCAWQRRCVDFKLWPSAGDGLHLYELKLGSML
jgi:hypothetical protein